MKQLLITICTICLITTIGCDSNKKEMESATIEKINQNKKDNTMENQSKATMDLAMKFMDAMGKGDMETMMSLMHEDMVWQNAGDSNVPWIGPWNGKKIILEDFMPKFGAGFKTIKWEPNDAFASGDTAAFFGQMIGELTNSNQQTKEFTYALRVKAKDGKVILWNWFEDSFEVSRAYHGK